MIKIVVAKNKTVSRKYEQLGIRGKWHTHDEKDYIEKSDFSGLEGKLERLSLPEDTHLLLLVIKDPKVGIILYSPF